MIPANVEVFGLQIHFYGLIIGLGIVAGTSMGVKAIRVLGKRKVKLSVTEEDVWQGLWWALIGGVVGARLYHVIDLWEVYVQNPARMLAVWNGGLGIYGAMMGGVLGIYLFTRMKRIKILEALDVTALGLPLGQAIGRWGNYVNQELYGKPTNLPWSILIEPANRVAGYEAFARFHPLFIYEAMGMLLVFLVLWQLFVKRWQRVGSGAFAAAYLVGYGSVRLVLEPLRLESWRVGGIATAQALSLAAILGGLMWIVYIRKRDENYR